MSDGLVASIVVNKRNQLANRDIPAQSKQQLGAKQIRLVKGVTIDLIIACGKNESFDSFKWNPVIKTAKQTWTYADGFSPAKKHQNPWQQYAQALLSTNEFAFVD